MERLHPVGEILTTNEELDHGSQAVKPEQVIDLLYEPGFEAMEFFGDWTALSSNGAAMITNAVNTFADYSCN